MRTLVLLASVLAILFCTGSSGGSCMVPAGAMRTVEHSTLVPPPTLPTPIAPTGRADLVLRDPSALYLGEPSHLAGQTEGLWVARTSLDGTVTAWPHRNFGLHVGGQVNLFGGALSTGTLTAGPDEVGGTFVVGPQFRYRFAGGDSVTLGISLEFRLSNLPSRVRAVALEDDPDFEGEEVDALNLVPGFGGSILVGTPMWRHGWAWVAVGGMTTVTNRGRFKEHGFVAERFDKDGPLYPRPLESELAYSGAVVLAIGGEWRPVDALGLFATVEWPVWSGPLRYPPYLGFGIRGVLDPRFH